MAPRVEVSSEMMYEKLWEDSDLDTLWSDLKGGAYERVVLLVGSAVSYGMPSECLSVQAVRRGVLSALTERAASTTAAAAQTLKLLDQPTGSNDARQSKLAADLRDLPFEQFLACVHTASSSTAFRIAELICAGSVSNANHMATAWISDALLRQGLARNVTIITTNYDTCLDKALVDKFGDLQRVRGSASLFPRYECHPPFGGHLCYLKPHGCVTVQESMVFTFSQMMRLLVKNKWTVDTLEWLAPAGRRCSTLGIAVGYGFWDPDLRELLRSLLGSARIYRNEHPRYREEDPSSATAQLQREFFELLQSDRCDLRVVKTELASDSPACSAGENVLTFLCRRLTGEVQPIPGRSSNELRARFEEAFTSWESSEVTHFLSRLLHALNCSAGRDLFLEQLLIEQHGPRQVDFAHAYLRTFGNENDWPGGASAARQLRSRRLSRDIDLVTLGYESFMETLRSDLSMRARAKKGLWCLLAAYSRWPFGTRKAWAVFAEYNTHFWVKSLQATIQLASGVSIVHGATRAFATVAGLIMKVRLRSVEAARDFDVYGDTAALFTELKILAGHSTRAQTEATRARVFRTAIGRASNAIQGDRLLGWALLADGKREKRFEAMQAFARGLLFSLLLPEEPSLARKSGANLIRVGFSDDALVDSKLSPEEHSAKRVADACRVLLRVGFGAREGEELREAMKTVAEHVLHLFRPNEELLLAELERFSDLTRYPMYLPLCEPK